MQLPTSTRHPLVTWTTVTATATAAAALAFLGGSPSAAGAAAAPARAAEPVVTPLATALVPGPIDVDRKATSNVVTASIAFAPKASTGWHLHSGPVLVQVVSGTLTLRHAVGRHCDTDVIRAGHGFFEAAGAVHKATNRGRRPAAVVATFILPKGAAPELPAPVPAACR